jgi:hypothetical protein
MEPDQPRISNDARDEPDIFLLGGIEAEDAEGLAERAWREVWKALAQNVTLGIAVKLALVDFP